MYHDLPETRSIQRKAHNTNGCECYASQRVNFANLIKSVCEGSKIKIGKTFEFLRVRIGQIRRPMFVNNDIEVNDYLKKDIQQFLSLRSILRYIRHMKI